MEWLILTVIFIFLAIVAIIHGRQTAQEFIVYGCRLTYAHVMGSMVTGALLFAATWYDLGTGGFVILSLAGCWAFSFAAQVIATLCRHRRPIGRPEI